MRQVAFIFDLDGLLIDTMPIYTKAWKKALVDNGADPNYTIDWILLAGLSVVDIAKHHVHKCQLKISPTALFKQVRQHVDEYIYTNPIELMPGIEEFMQVTAKHKIPRAIGTSGLRNHAEHYLRVTPLHHYFNIVVTEAQVDKAKPNPGIFLEAARIINIPPQNCVVFEDAPKGIEAAKRANMTAIAVIGSRQLSQKRAFYQADQIYETFHDVKFSHPQELVRK